MTSDEIIEESGKRWLPPFVDERAYFAGAWDARDLAFAEDLDRDARVKKRRSVREGDVFAGVVNRLRESLARGNVGIA